MRPTPRFDRAPLAAAPIALAAALAAACAPAADRIPAPAPDPVRSGLLLFNDTALSGDGRWACATCHPRGGHTDNQTYVGTDVVAHGTPEGRSTPLLWGVKDTGPYSWAGGKTLKDNIKGIIVNRMKGPEPTDAQLDALVAYLESLEFPANPNLNPDGSPSAAAPEAARRGFRAFQRAACNSCHVPPMFAKPDNEDIGTGGSFSVPSLRGLATTAPYLHDGRHPDLRSLLPAKLELLEALGQGETLGPQEIEDLLVYLNLL
jgi:cytochrome c peroxidase